MADLDFFVDVVVSGAVLGVGLTDSPETVARVLGEGFVEDRGRATLRRDYGMLEFFWSRRSGSEPWYAGGFSVQARRLPDVDVGEELVGRYGRFGGRLRFAPPTWLKQRHLVSTVHFIRKTTAVVRGL